MSRKKKEVMCTLSSLSLATRQQLKKFEAGPKKNTHTQGKRKKTFVAQRAVNNQKKFFKKKNFTSIWHARLIHDLNFSRKRTKKKKICVSVRVEQREGKNNNKN